MINNIFFSIIVPAHNEENRLQDTLRKITDYLEAQSYKTEIIIVENGSTDCTAEIAKEFALGYAAEPAHGKSQICLIQESASGKGLAVRRGMLEATGDYRFMCDADLSMPITELHKFLHPAHTNFDIAIASRESPGAVRYNEPFYRQLGGRMINMMVRLLALPGLHDTQCGFKCFRASAAEDIFNHQTLTGWAFDIEVLFIARQRGYCIAEIPISWYFTPDSKLNVILDAFRMGLDILKIRLNALQGKYAHHNQM